MGGCCVTPYEDLLSHIMAFVFNGEGDTSQAHDVSVFYLFYYICSVAVFHT